MMTDPKRRDSTADAAGGGQVRLWGALAAIGSVLAIFALAAGCQGQLSVQARERLQSAYASYDAGNDAETIDLMDKFLASDTSSPRADEAHYLRGMARYRRSDLVGAKEDLEAAVAKTDNKDLRARARITLGDIAYQGDDLALAERLYRSAQAEIEQGRQPSDRAYFQLGCVLQKQGRWKEADVQFDRVVYLFAGSDLAAEAAGRTHCTAWTIQTSAPASRASAEAEVKRLSDKGLQAHVKPDISDGRPVFLVQVGRFAAYKQAASELPAVRQLQGEAFVTVTR